MGTLVLEWTRLSDLTGNQTYAELAQLCEAYLLNPTGAPEAFPGLPGSSISTETGEFLNSNGGWSGGTDSFYEYLIKMYLYDPDEFASYKERWIAAADSTMAHLASHPTSRQDLTFLKQYDGQTTYPATGHCKSRISSFRRSFTD
jgi:mannosyl-oligosaccharide alpha-1,2-mannosidase